MENTCLLPAGSFCVQNELTTQVWTCRFQSTKLSDFASILHQIKYYQKKLRWSITIDRKLLYFCCLKLGPLQYSKVQVVQKSNTVPGILKAAWSKIFGDPQIMSKIQSSSSTSVFLKTTVSTYSFIF